MCVCSFRNFYYFNCIKYTLYKYTILYYNFYYLYEKGLLDGEKK